ncbi:MAG: DUF934 domain-containing protein [Myxococcota bacterium]
MALLEPKGDSAAVVEDRFTRVDDEGALPASGGVLVSLSRFQTERDALLARDGDLGVWLASDESPTDIADADFAKIALVALDFPVFSDGRAFTSARILKERMQYAGEIRAMGEVMLEQVPYMLRSGFTTFDTEDKAILEEWKSVVGEVRVVYQPTGDGRATAIDRRLGRS